MKNYYIEDIKNVVNSIKGKEKIKNKTVFVSGSTGLIGKFIVDTIMFLNKELDYNCKIVANSRKKQEIEEKFADYLEDKCFDYYIGDINNKVNYDRKVNFIINCASNTHPLQYATDPIGTIMTNIKGTDSILEFAVKNKAEKTIFLSSVEIYGENINNIDRFKENQMGYINCNSLRAGYNEGKRAGEALCQAYIEAKDIDVSIVRLPRIYGPTVKKDDTKVMSQFINKALNKENIVLKSEGNQYFSYLYVADAVSGILEVLLNGKKGEAYNLGNVASDIRLKDLAELCAKLAGTKVIFDLPSEKELKGFSKATVARLDYTKISKELGWRPMYSIKKGVGQTLKILENKKNNER